MEPGNEAYRFDYLAELLAHLNFEAGRLVAEPAVHDFPDSPRVQVALGVALFGLERFAQAQEIFLGAAQRFPDAGLSLLYLTLAPETSNIPIPGAKQLLKTFHSRHPEQFLSPYLLGHMALFDSDPGSASQLLQESIRLDRNYPLAHLELGRCYADLGRYREAISEFRTAARLDPKQTEAWYRLALAYRRAGERKLAAEAELKFRNVEPTTG